MLYLGRDVILSAIADDTDHPLVGYDNVVTSTNIEADSESSGSPASNLANPATHLKWVSGSTADQDITITLSGSDEVGYIGIAGHNFGSTSATISIEATLGSTSPPTTVILADPVIPGDDSPLMWWIDPSVTATSITIHLENLTEEPSAAVVSAGFVLSMERKLYAEHTPITWGRKLDVSNGRSESGEFMGRIITGESRETTAAFRLFTPAWYRENMPDFLEAAKTLPFFFAWRPTTYPEEVGYVFLLDDPMPSPRGGDGNLIAFELKLGGVT